MSFFKHYPGLFIPLDKGTSSVPVTYKRGLYCEEGSLLQDSFSLTEINSKNRNDPELMMRAHEKKAEKQTHSGS